MGERRGSTWGEWLSAGLLIAFLVFAVGFLYCQRHHLDALASLGIGHLVGIVTLGAVSLILLGVAQWILFRDLARGLRVADSVQLAISLNFLNYLPAKAGLFGRGAYLHRVHSVAVNDYIGLTVRSKLITLAATSAVAAVVGFASAPIDNGPWIWVAGGLTLVTLISVGVYFCGHWALTFTERLPLIPWLSQHLRYQQKPLGVSVIGRFSGLVIAAMFCRAARLYVIFAVLEHPLDPAAVVVMEAANGVIALVGLMPGNLGLREGGLASLAVAFGVPWHTVVPAVLLDRLATLVVPFAIGPWVTHRLSRQMLRPVSKGAR